MSIPRSIRQRCTTDPAMVTVLTRQEALEAPSGGGVYRSSGFGVVTAPRSARYRFGTTFAAAGRGHPECRNGGNGQVELADPST